MTCLLGPSSGLPDVPCRVLRPRTADISVIIQGPLYRNSAEGVERCLASIRQVLPGAEIIVSTWDSENVEGLGDDIVLVQSSDPGCFRDFDGVAYNLNRQLVTTAAGLWKASRPFALKIRADHALADGTICQVRESGGSPVITMTTLYVPDPTRYPALFHASDTVQFARTSSMREFWDSALFLESTVMYPEARAWQWGSAWRKSRVRLAPEQALTLRWLNRTQDQPEIMLQHPCHMPPSLIAQWAVALREKFNTLDWRESGVVFPRRFTSDRHGRHVFDARGLRRLEDRNFSIVRCRLNQYLFQYDYLRLGYALLSQLLRWALPDAHAVLKAARDKCVPLRTYMMRRFSK